MGSLYLVATPIGNLEDITLRALRVLREVDLIAAEDTRHSGRLLKHYEITTPMVRYDEHSGPGRVAELIERLDLSDVALISDAGMPGISDPGFALVRAASERGIAVVPVPGPSALIAAAAASGLVPHSFLFLGFLPRRPGERRATLASVRELDAPLVLYEAPHRLESALVDIAATLGDRPLALARELTKLHEEIERTTVTRALARLAERPPRGEYVLVLGPPPPPQTPALTDDDVVARLRASLRSGASAAVAAREVARETGLPRRELYQLALALR